MEKPQINALELAKKTTEAKSKIAQGEAELADVRKTVEEHQDVLEHEAHLDYLVKLNKDLDEVIASGNQQKAEELRKEITDHKQSLEELKKSNKNLGDYFDKKGEVDMEKFQKQMDAFMLETFTIWYSEKDAQKAKLAMSATPLDQIDYEKMRKDVDASKFGEYSINPETAGLNFQEKEPKIKILNEELKQFIGQPRSEVIKFVVDNYGKDYHIPGLEYEQYLLNNPNKVPKELKDGNWYYFMGSTLRTQGGDALVPTLHWNGDELDRSAAWLKNFWFGSDRVFLLEK